MTTHLLFSAEDSEVFLLEELSRHLPGTQPAPIGSSLIQFQADLNPTGEPPPPLLAFARQFLPDAQTVHAESISGWSQAIFDRMLDRMNDPHPWRLFIDPHFGEFGAGRNRCQFIRENLMDRLQKKRRHLRRQYRESQDPWGAEETAVQVLLTSPETGWVSIAPAPWPQRWASWITPFPKGDIPVAVDKTAPSRAFTKLVETEQRMGRRIQPGETCVDLGASPGSWSYVALQRGARVHAVDRAELRSDLMRNPRLTFTQGDAFKFTPPQRVDWLLCDVIATPQRSVELLHRWLKDKLARRFMVSIKFKGHDEYGILEDVKRDLPPLCSSLGLTRLCANKNEVCCFGVIHE